MTSLVRVSLVAGLAALLLVLLAPAPARAQEVRPLSFQSGAARIEGELFLPPGPGPHPAVVLLHDSGSGDRAPYRPEARAFARRGVAAYVFDRRGSGRSGGQPYPRYIQLAYDARIAVRTVARQPEIRPDGVALWGLGEGALVAPLAAAGRSEVAAVLVVSPSALRPGVQQEWAVRNALRADGAAPLATRPVTTFYRLLIDLGSTDLARRALRRTSDLAFEPPAVWTAVDQPVLAVWGQDDELVPIRASARALQAGLAAGVNRDRIFRSYRDASHALAVGVVGGRLVLPPGYRDASAAWLRSRLRPSPPEPVVRTPLPPANGVVAPLGLVPVPWHTRTVVQLAWLALPAAVLALTLLARQAWRSRRGAAPAVVAALLAGIGVLGLAVALAAITSAGGEGVVLVAGYPALLLAAVVPGVAALVMLAVWIARGAPSVTGKIAALAAGGWLALLVYWLL